MSELSRNITSLENSLMVIEKNPSLRVLKMWVPLSVILLQTFTNSRYCLKFYLFVLITKFYLLWQSNILLSSTPREIKRRKQLLINLRNEVVKLESYERAECYIYIYNLYSFWLLYNYYY